MVNFLGVIAVSLCWGLGGPLSWYATQSLSPMAAAFGRCGFAFLGLSPFFLLYGKKIFKALDQTGRNLLVLSGLVLGLHFFLFVAGVAYASLSTAVMLVAVEPVLVLCVGVVWFKEKLTLGSAIGILFCVFGIGVISVLPYLLDGVGTEHTNSSNDTFKRAIGDACTVAAVLGYAVYYGLNRAFRSKESRLTHLFHHVNSNRKSLVSSFSLASVIYFFAAFSSGLLFLFTHQISPMLSDNVYVATSAIDFRTWLAVFGMAFIPTILGHTLNQVVSRRAHPVWVSLMSPGETLMALMIGYVFLGQSLRVYDLWGGLLILFGVGFTLHSEMKNH